MRTLLFLLAGFILGAAVALGLALLVVALTNAPSNSGGREMEIIFFWMPLGAILGAVVALVWRLRA